VAAIFVILILISIKMTMIRDQPGSNQVPILSRIKDNFIHHNKGINSWSLNGKGLVISYLSTCNKG
jgi:hypothetical protein